MVKMSLREARRNGLRLIISRKTGRERQLRVRRRKPRY
jgi:hypothetical protein